MVDIIFLDCDGVLNTGKSCSLIDDDKLDLLQHIIKTTNAKLVITSEWR